MQRRVVVKLLLVFLFFTFLQTSFAEDQLRADLEFETKLGNYSVSELYQLAVSKKNDADSQNALFLFVRVINETSPIVENDQFTDQLSEDYKLYADASTNAGIIYFNRGDYARSLEYFYNALGAYRLLGDASGVGNLLNNVGTVYFDWSEYELALEYFLDAEKVYNENGLKNIQTILLNNIGSVYVRLQDYEKGLDFFKKSLEIALNRNSEYTFSQLHNIGYIYYKTTKLDMAADYVIKSLEVARSHDRKKDLALALVTLARINIQSNNYREADSVLRLGLENAQKEGALDEIKQIYQIWSELQQKRQDYPKALEYHKKYFQIHDSLFNAEKHAQIKELQVLYETEKREQEIQLLNVEKQFKTHQIETQKRWIEMLVSLVIIITLLLIVVYLQKRKQTRANLDLVRKNLEIVESEQWIMKKADIIQDKTENTIYELETAAALDSSGNSNAVFQDADGLPQVHNAGKYSNSNLSYEQKREILNDLTEKMEKKHLYRNPNITLELISELLKTNRTYISQVINEETSGNFMSFVNSYRIKEARRMLADDSYNNLTIEAIARHVGFNSKSSFNNFFKKSTGITPSYFQKNARIGKES